MWQNKSLQNFSARFEPLSHRLPAFFIRYMYFIKKSYLTFTDQNSIKILPLSSSDCSLMSSVMPFSFLKRHFCSFQNDQDKFLLKFNNKESFYGYGPSEFLNKEGRGFVDRSLEEVVETSS